MNVSHSNRAKFRQSRKAIANWILIEARTVYTGHHIPATIFLSSEEATLRVQVALQSQV